MPNPRGKPENLPIYPARGEEPLDDNLSFRVTKSMKQEVKAQDDPAEFCREAIQEKLDKNKSK